jgi:REP element-mobilizing transposase RayT
MLRSIHDLNNRQACYFISFDTVDWVDVFIRPVYKQVIVHTLNHFIESKGLRVHAWCLMSNHLHLIAQSEDGFDIADIENEYRVFTSLKILEALDAEPAIRKEWMLERFEISANKQGLPNNPHIWQSCSSPVYIDLVNLTEALDYFEFIHDKPVRDRYVDMAVDYLYSSARDYAGIKGLVNICKPATVEQQLAASESVNDNFFVKYIRN